mgnify:CR=1 FL=1
MALIVNRNYPYVFKRLIAYLILIVYKSQVFVKMCYLLDAIFS